jgi:DNA-binding LacI/PurR family transcriptional regulator
MKAVTLQDLADTLGVARSTVSRALRDDPQISPDTRLHVRRLARDLGYHPNAAARALTRRHSGVVGVVLPRSAAFVFANPYFSTLLEGIATVAEDAGLPILFSASPAPDYERWLREGRVDGLIALGYSLHALDLERLEALAGGSAAIALVGAPPRATVLPTVTVDEAPGIAAACDRLAHAGHRALALVTGPANAVYARARADLLCALAVARGV